MSGKRHVSRCPPPPDLTLRIAIRSGAEPLEGLPLLCLHPHCPMRAAPGTWDESVDHPAMKVRPALRAALLADLNTRFGAPASPAVARDPPVMSKGQLRTLLNLSPCLFNQIEINPTARGIVHLCEVALGTPITSANVHKAFLIQHPKMPGFTVPPIGEGRSGGAIMEMLCSETLASGGIPAMLLGKDKWPEWRMPGHVLLNEGKMAALKALGDILIPCAPTNIVISIRRRSASTTATNSTPDRSKRPRRSPRVCSARPRPMARNR